ITGWPHDITVIDIGAGEEVMRITASNWVTPAWSPDGRWIATASGDGTAEIWDARTGEMWLTLFGHSSLLLAIDWAPDSERIATGSGDGTAKVWQLSDAGPQELLTLASRDVSGVGGLAFSPDGTMLLTGDFRDNAIKVWDVGIAGDAEWTNLPAQVRAEGALAYAGDGSSVIASSGDGSVTVWDATNYAETLVTHQHDGPVISIDISPDGRWVASGGEDGVVRVWDRYTGQVRFTHRAAATEASRVEAVAWSSDGVLAIARDGDPVVVVDSEGDQVDSLDVEAGLVAGALAWSPSGDRLAVSLVTGDSERWDITRHQIQVWDWQTGEIADSLMETTSSSLAFDPSGERIATVDVTLTSAQVWDLASDTVNELDRGSGALQDIAWSPDGALIATAGADGAIRLWAAETGVQRLALHGHRSSVDKVRFSPDGSTLASVAPDGTLRIWALDLDDLIDLAWSKLSREFTDADCQALLGVAECPDP
ncbi:MAG TPA: WD40 repeat domain-containing protein, partial [Gemmatimonadales bacterium]|nr:WD40 repeat domain-containing protein [Gemmatimonadales bacterium]